VLCIVIALPAVAAVRIEGLDAELEANVLAHMRLDDEACDQTRVRVQYGFDRAPDSIRAALRPFGYYEPKIEATLEMPAEGCWQAVFKVDAGEPVLVQATEIRVEQEGEELPVFSRLIEDSDIRIGERLEHDTYEALKSRLLVAAHEYGFFEAKLTRSVIEVDKAKHSATVALVMHTGPRYRFGQLEVREDILDNRLILRYVDFEEGAPFEQRRLRKLHNDLVRGDYFSSVSVRAYPDEVEKIARVRLTLEEGRRIRYGVGAGFGTDTGLVLRADMVHRRLNRHGHRLELDGEVSKVRQNATIDYRIPGKRPQNDWYSIYGGINREDTEAIESISWKMGARPTQGLRMRGEVAGAAKQVLSDASFIRFYFNGKTILPLSERGRVLLRGEAGWMATDDFDNVPPTWRFFAGGDRSVRGYDYQSLGPLDENGKAIGGRKLLTGSIEGDWRFFERWSAAVFVDAGNVGEEDLLKDVPWSVGAGVRWYSPVGPIRLDLAFPQNGSGDFRVHISMGPDL
jgi:translocation and assembly module TamA